MRYKWVIIIGLILLSTFLNAGEEKSKHHFSVVVASCFHSDTVGLNINGNVVIDNEIASSDFSTGVTNIAVYQTDGGLFTFSGNDDGKRLNPVEFKRNITVEILVNGIRTIRTIDLKKGKIIFVDNCSFEEAKGQTSKRVMFKQFRKTVALE